MAQGVRVLTVQHEDLSSNPQYSGKKLDMIVHAPVTQCCGKGGDRGPMDNGACWPSAQFQVQ